MLRTLLREPRLPKLCPELHMPLQREMSQVGAVEGCQRKGVLTPQEIAGVSPKSSGTMKNPLVWPFPKKKGGGFPSRPQEMWPC